MLEDIDLGGIDPEDLAAAMAMVSLPLYVVHWMCTEGKTHVAAIPMSKGTVHAVSLFSTPSEARVWAEGLAPEQTYEIKELANRLAYAAWLDELPGEACVRMGAASDQVGVPILPVSVLRAMVWPAGRG